MFRFAPRVLRLVARALSLSGVLVALSATQAVAEVRSVPAGGDLQATLDVAQPGDLILLAPGATYTGSFTLGNKPGTGFITVRTDAAGLPGPGERITPAQAGSLAKIAAGSRSSAALTTAQGAHHWRIELVEFVGNGGGDLIVLGGTQTQEAQMPHDLIFDRVYVHGDPILGQKRGIALNGATIHILNSYISDIKAVGQDTQALCGWNGTGPFVIDNNYLEAAGENVMFGGADPTIWNLVPSDITIRRNVLSKPLAWRSERWTVKNLLELKNARRVLIEGNVLENVWQQAQSGFAVVLTTRNQSGNAPWSVVEDVTIRRNIIRHAGSGFNVTGFDDIRPSAQGRRMLISQNLVYDIDGGKWGGTGRFLQIGNQPRDVTVEKNTVVNTGNLVTAYGKPIEGFVFRNNLTRHNTYGVIGDGQAAGNATLNTYFPGATFERNVLAGGRASSYPAGNYFPSVGEFEASFTSMVSENFALVAGSSLGWSASDGGSVGVDMTALTTALESGASAAPATPGLPDVDKNPFIPSID